MSVSRFSGRQRLISPPVLLLIIVLVAVLFYALLPRSAVLFAMVPDDRADAVAIQYLRFALKSDPDNATIRYLLARQLYLAGQHEQAWEVLRPLMVMREQAQRLPRSFVSLYAALLAHRFYSAEDARVKARLRQQAHELLAGIDFSGWSADQLRALSQRLEGWVDDQDLITLLEWQLRKESDPNRRVEISRTLVLALFRSGRFDEMVEWMKACFGRLDAPRREPAALWMLDLALATGDPERAWSLAGWLLERTPGSVALLDRAIDIAGQTGHMDDQLRLMQRRLTLKPDPDVAWRLFTWQVAKGQLRAALSLVPVLEWGGMTLSQIRRVAQVNEWAGRPDQALSWWMRYARRVKNRQVDQKAWRLAIGVYRLDRARQILEQAARYRALTAEELNELVAIYLDEGRFDKARRFLRTHVFSRGLSVDALRTLYVFYVEVRDYAQALEVLRNGEQKGLLTPQMWMDYVSLLWLTRRPDEAMRVIRSAERWLADRQDYWERRLSLALYENDYTDALHAFETLAHHHVRWRPDPPLVKSIASGLMVSGRREAAARLLMRHGDSEGRLLAVRIMLDLGRVETAERWLAQVDWPDRPALQAVYWSARARLHELKHQYDAALKSWARALALAPDNRDIQQAFVWSMIAGVERTGPQLVQTLARIASSVPDGADWVAILAYGHMAIGEYERALHWFRKGLAAHQEDVDWLLGMADAFDLSGFGAYADRLRRHVWQQLMVRHLAGSLDDSQTLRRRLIVLTRRYGGSVLAQAVLAEVIGSLDRQVRIETLMAQALARGRVMLAQYYYARAWSRAVRLPGWEKLGYGLMTSDREVLARTLQEYAHLPRADRVMALYRLGRSAQAVATGAADLREGIGETVIGQIRRAVASVRAPLEQGFRMGIRLQTRDILDVDTISLQAGRLLDGERSWGIRIVRHRLRSEAVVPIHLREQTDVVLMWKSWQARQKWTLTLTMQDRGGDASVAGFAGEWAEQRYRNLRYGVRLYHDTRPQISGTLWGWGLQQGVEASIDYAWDAKVSLSLLAGWRRFESLWREPLGEGPYGQLVLTHRLWMGDPVWDLSGSIEWFSHSNSVASADRLLRRFVTVQDPQAILPSDYGRFGLTSSWYHGQLHRIAHEVPSPRWAVSISLGYQWVRGVFDYGISAGLGWRVTEDDELALSMRWGTDGLSNVDPYWGVRLTYSVFWDR